jgi:acetyltransferase-like isoleucine patch superfamily enzyme
MKTSTRIWQRILRFLGITPFTKFDSTHLPYGMSMGEGGRIFGIPCIKINREARIICGKGVVLNSDPQGYHAGMGFPVTLLADRPNAQITIGDESRLHGCCIHAWSQISIGKKCLLAAGSQVLDSHGHATEIEYARLRIKVQDIPESIQIGDFCWLGLGALVFKGVKLGEGCIVAAYSVVLAGEYHPFSLLAGSPAKIIRSLPETAIYPEDSSIDDLLLDGKKVFQY